MSEMKSLAKDTAIYGISSIVGKFLNWLLTPFYTFVLVYKTELGSVTNLYAWSAFLLIILTYGMETGFFRFANKNIDKSDKVYGNALISVGFTSLLFVILIILFNHSIANILGYGKHPEYILILGIIAAMDAFSSIPFAYLRFSKRPIVFAGLKFFYVILNIIFNLFFFLLCPWLMKVAPESVSWFYDSNYGVGYVFIANLLSTTIQTIVLLRYIFVAKFEFDGQLLKQILKYSYPLLFLGIAGVANQNLDKILFPFLQIGDQGKADLGIYGAVSKIAMVIMMFTQAFRYAYEPFVFAKNKDKNSLQTYSDAMKYFIMCSLLIFLGIVFYLDLIKYIIRSDYWIGLNVVPVILLSFIFQGIFFNLSIWYKLTDNNKYGAWFSIAGTIIVFLGNIFLVPKFSYWGSAWSAFAGYFTVMLLSYFIGQKKYPISYNLRSAFFYTALVAILYIAGMFPHIESIVLRLAYRTVLLMILMGIIFINIKKELKKSKN